MRRFSFKNMHLKIHSRNDLSMVHTQDLLPSEPQSTVIDNDARLLIITIFIRGYSTQNKRGKPYISQIFAGLQILDHGPNNGILSVIHHRHSCVPNIPLCWFHTEFFISPHATIHNPLKLEVVLHIITHGCNRQIAQIPKCTCPVSHNTPLRKKKMCTFLFRSSALWDMGHEHYGICKIGLTFLDPFY